MTSCLSAGGRTYTLDLEIIKSPSHSTRTSHTSSPSSTLSEASNSPLAISTRKARTPRKRPNQTYNEAAALLSTVYPSIFSNPGKFIKPHQPFFDDSSELLLPFRVIHDSGFLLHQRPIQDKAPRFSFDRKVSSLVDNSCQGSSMQLSNEFNEDFDAESILDEEIEEGIDSIMGNLSVDNEAIHNESNNNNYNYNNSCNYWYANPMGLGFGGKLEFGLGIRRGVRALRHVDEGNWWSFPIVDVLQISPKFNHSNPNSSNSSDKRVQSQKKKKKVEKEKPAAVAVELNSPPKTPISGELQLKLQYDDVLKAWSDRGSPFLDESLCSHVQGNDVSARLAQIDLFSESGVREASVQRYKEKRRTRLFSKKIRYQVRKVNADRRPRMKGRFVRRSNPSSSAQDEKGRKKVMLCDL